MFTGPPTSFFFDCEGCNGLNYTLLVGMLIFFLCWNRKRLKIEFRIHVIVIVWLKGFNLRVSFMLIMLTEQFHWILNHQTHHFLSCPSKTGSTQHTLTLLSRTGVPKPAGNWIWELNYWVSDLDFILTGCVIMENIIFLCLNFLLCKMVIITIPVSCSCFWRLIVSTYL